MPTKQFCEKLLSMSDNSSKMYVLTYKKTQEHSVRILHMAYGIYCIYIIYVSLQCPDSKVHGANMGPILGRQDPGGPHVGPTNFAIWVMLHERHSIGNHWQINVCSCLFMLTTHTKKSTRDYHQWPFVGDMRRSRWFPSQRTKWCGKHFHVIMFELFRRDLWSSCAGHTIWRWIWVDGPSLCFHQRSGDRDSSLDRWLIRKTRESVRIVIFLILCPNISETNPVPRFMFCCALLYVGTVQLNPYFSHYNEVTMRAMVS